MGTRTWGPGRAPEGQLGTDWSRGHSAQRESPTTHSARTLHHTPLYTTYAPPHMHTSYAEIHTHTSHPAGPQ